MTLRKRKSQLSMLLICLLVIFPAIETADAGGKKRGIRFGGRHKPFCSISPDTRDITLPSMTAGTRVRTGLYVRCNVKFELRVKPGINGVLENQEFSENIVGFSREAPYQLSFAPFGPGVRTWWYKGPLFVTMTLSDPGKPLLAGTYAETVTIEVDPGY